MEKTARTHEHRGFQITPSYSSPTTGRPCRSVQGWNYEKPGAPFNNGVSRALPVTTRWAPTLVDAKGEIDKHWEAARGRSPRGLTRYKAEYLEWLIAAFGHTPGNERNAASIELERRASLPPKPDEAEAVAAARRHATAARDAIEQRFNAALHGKAEEPDAEEVDALTERYNHALQHLAAAISEARTSTEEAAQ